MAWITPITGRTVGAVYTPEDLNRVGEDVQYLANQFNLYGYVVMVEAKTDWTLGEIHRRTRMTTYLANVQALIDAYYTLSATPNVPESMRFLTWAKANDIERILLDMKYLLGQMLEGFIYSGTFYTNEGVIL